MAERATGLMSHLSLIVSSFHICDAGFGVGMIDSISRCVTNTWLTELWLQITATIGEDGRNSGLRRLPKAMATNNSIKELLFYRTDLVVMDNVEQWGVALTTNKTLGWLSLGGPEAEVVK